MNASTKIPALAGVAVLLAGLGMFAWSYVGQDGDEPTVQVRVPTLSPLAISGGRAFDANCAACHGKNGGGTDLGPPLVHDIYNPGHHANEAFLRAVRNGVPQHHWRFGDMPPQPQVSDSQLAEIVQYMRELQAANGVTFKPHRM